MRLKRYRELRIRCECIELPLSKSIASAERNSGDADVMASRPTDNMAFGLGAGSTRSYPGRPGPGPVQQQQKR